MPHMLPAQSISPEGEFYVVRDADNEPMVFSIGNNGILYLSLRGATGNYELVDLSEKFGISSPNHVQALSVTQDQCSTLYIVFAVGASGSESTIDIVRALKPWDVDWTAEESLEDLIYKGETQSRVVEKIWVVSRGNICALNKLLIPNRGPTILKTPLQHTLSSPFNTETYTATQKTFGVLLLIPRIANGHSKMIYNCRVILLTFLASALGLFRITEGFFSFGKTRNKKT